MQLLYCGSYNYNYLYNYIYFLSYNFCEPVTYKQFIIQMHLM